MRHVPADEDVALGLARDARAAARRGDAADAARLYRAAFELDRRAADAAAEHYAAEPARSRAHRRAAWSAVRAGEFGRAEHLARRGLAGDPSADDALELCDLWRRAAAAAPAGAPRNLVLCFDGTNNQFGAENTSVVRVVQALDRHPDRQRLYYDPGVGTLPEPGVWSRLGQRVSVALGLAFGAGLVRKVEAAYAYLMNTWEPGDRVFLFGFSRGAYAARVLAGMLHSVGLLPRRNDNLIPYATRLYRAVRRDTRRGEPRPADGDPAAGYWQLLDDFRWTFARPAPGGGDERHFRVHFMGLWDTVSSVGWAWDPATFPFTAANPSVGSVRHAVSIDERRWFFRQNLMRRSGDGQALHQAWFPGVHSDVGGGYPERLGGLWRAPFEWVLDGACDAGLRLDPQRYRTVVSRTRVPDRPWAEPQQESLRGLWWNLAEYFPKLAWQRRPPLPPPPPPGQPGPASPADPAEPVTWRKVPRLGRHRGRRVPPGERIHRSALLRLRDDPAYRPSNLSADFVARYAAAGTEVVDETVPYEP